MARKRARQQRIPGTEPPDIPAEVIEKGQDYAEALSERMSMQKREDTLRAELLDMAKGHGLDNVEVDVDTHVLTITHETKDEYKVKSKKKPEPDED